MEIEALTKLVQNFCEEREWDQFHAPKELAIGISTEAAELLDLFRFKTPEQIQTLFKESKSKEKIQDELADVFFFILRFGQMNGINLSQALQNKMQKNAAKYPVETARGSNKKYNE